MNSSAVSLSQSSRPAAKCFDTERMVTLIAAGQPEGEQLLYESYAKGLRFLALRYCPEHAEDCMQDTIVSAIRQIEAGKLRVPGALPGYLATMLKRIAWNKRRQSARCIGDREAFHSVVNAIADDRLDPEHSLQIQEQGRLVRDGLYQLRSVQREILSRFYLQAQTPEQICHEMNLTSTQFRLLKYRSKYILEEVVSNTMTRFPSELGGRYCGARNRS